MDRRVVPAAFLALGVVLSAAPLYPGVPAGGAAAPLYRTVLPTAGIVSALAALAGTRQRLTPERAIGLAVIAVGFSLVYDLAIGPLVSAPGAGSGGLLPRFAVAALFALGVAARARSARAVEAVLALSLFVFGLSALSARRRRELFSVLALASGDGPLGVSVPGIAALSLPFLLGYGYRALRAGGE